MNTAGNKTVATSEETAERELCRTCLEPNLPGATFCKDCGAPLSSYAATGPFESLLAEGHVYRQAAEHPQKLIVILGMWAIFGATALVGASLFVASFGMSGLLWARLFGLAVFGIASAVLWRTTRNYLRIRAEARKTSPTPV